MKADRVSTRVGRLSWLLLSVYLARRAASEAASNTNLLVLTSVIIPEFSGYPDTSIGGKREAESKHGVTVPVFPRAMAAQLLRNVKYDRASAILWDRHRLMASPPQSNRLTYREQI